MKINVSYPGIKTSLIACHEQGLAFLFFFHSDKGSTCFRDDKKTVFSGAIINSTHPRPSSPKFFQQSLVVSIYTTNPTHSMPSRNATVSTPKKVKYKVDKVVITPERRVPRKKLEIHVDETSSPGNVIISSPPPTHLFLMDEYQQTTL